MSPIQTGVPQTPPTTYLELIQQFPLRPLHDETDYDNAIAAADALAGLLEKTHDQEDYLVVLFHLIEEYEAEHHSVD